MVLTGSAARNGDSRRPLRFLARERELDRLRRRLEAASAGRGGVVVVSGPPGIGTTTLARQAAGRARQLGMHVLWGECLEGTLDRPYGGLADALEVHALGLSPETVVADLATDAGPILRVCPAMSEMVAAFAPAVPLDPADERLRLHEAVAGWLQRMARRTPLLVVVDGFGFADGDLLGLIGHLARRLRDVPALVVCVRGATATAHRSTRIPGTLQTLTLAGLDEGATAAMLADVADRPVAPATVALIQELTGGSPLFSTALYRHLLEEGLLPRPGSTSLPAPAALPQTLTDVVAWRIARLAPPSRAALHALAAFPHGAQPHIVATVAGLPRTRAVEALDALVVGGLVHADERQTHFAVAQPAIRLALLEALSPLLRAQLHRRVAEAIEAEASDRQRELAGVLAYHWSQSRSMPGRERGLGHCLVAAEQARAAYAYLRAVDCLRGAIGLAADDPSLQIDLIGRLATTEAAAGLRRAALATARRLLEVAPTSGQAHASPSAEALNGVVDTLRALRGTGIAVKEWPAFDQLRRAAVEALGSHRTPRGEPITRARLELMAERWQPLQLGPLTVSNWGDLQPDAARTLLAQASEADRAEVMLPQRPRSRADTAYAAEAARAWRRPPATLRALACTVTDLVSRHGMYREGAGWAAQYLATAERYGSLRDQVAALLHLARCQVALGNLPDAEESTARAQALLAPIAERGQLDDQLTVTRWTIAHFRDGDWATLISDLPPVDSPRPAGLLLAALRTIGHARLGNEAEARALLPAVLDATAQLPPLTYYRDAALVVILAAAWELGAAEHAASGRSLVDLAAKGGAGGQVEGTLELTRARMLALAGMVDQARALFAEQRVSLAAAGLLPLRAMCDHDEAIAIAAAGASGYGEAVHLLEAAAGQFEQVGMTGWLARTRQLLAKGLAAAAAPGGRLAFTYPCGLSRHEADAVRLVTGGATADEAAALLVLERTTVERLLARALEKMGGTRLDELPLLARRYGLGGV